MSQQYEFMEGAVQELCDAMRNNPERFVIDIYTLNDTKTGIKYWIGSSAHGCITEIDAGRANHTVFSNEQGKRVWQAYQLLREVNANRAQRRVLDAMGGVVINKIQTKQTNNSMPPILIPLGAILIVMLGLAVFKALIH